jgi:hypothetical protein
MGTWDCGDTIGNLRLRVPTRLTEEGALVKYSVPGFTIPALGPI